MTSEQHTFDLPDDGQTAPLQDAAPATSPARAGARPRLAPRTSRETPPATVPDTPLAWAQWAAARGWHVFPVRGKTPLLRHWPEQATTDPDQTRRWFATDNAPNVGIACGLSGLLVVDEDEPLALEKWAADHGHEVPETFAVLSREGRRHLYFAVADGQEFGNSRGALKGYGCDVRGKGGFVVGPGSVHETGSTYTPVALNIAPAPVPDWLAEALTKPEPRTSNSSEADTGPAMPTNYEATVVRGEVARLRDLPQPWHEGAGWDQTVFDAACNLFEVANSSWSLLTVEEAERLVRENAPTDPEWGSDKVTQKIESARSQTDGKTRAAPREAGRDVAPDLLDSPLAEWTAERLQARYCWAAGLGWLRYNGKVWQETTDANVVEAVRKLWRKRFAKEIADGADQVRAKQLNALLVGGKISGAVRLLKGILERRADQFDVQPDLLNVGNGVVDLRTGELLPHSPDLLLTKITKVKYDPDAEHSDWEQALHALHAKVADWMQVRFGQAATGYATSDDVLPVLQGNGANGKSTLVAAIMSALGDHAVVVPERVLLSNPSDHPTELTTLRGARVALIEETPEARHLNVKRLKDVVGTPTMTARKIRQDNISWSATHALFLTSNYRPRVNETDHGTWRRLALVSFPFTFRRPGEPLATEWDKTGDPRLRERLRAGREGQHEAVLAWVVAGARRWYEAGHVLPPPPEQVVAATTAWRHESDLVLAYMADRLDFDPNRCVLATELFADFSEWHESRGSGTRAWAENTFAQRFGEHDTATRKGVRKTRTRSLGGLSRRFRGTNSAPPGTATVWHGVRFRRTTDDDAQGAL
ncbi:phage/plasmid primase, P4 family [Nocardioides albidus]|uniref:phage/plasmid primase, P4 family n=1 Tax=Nocardioides albidus TaxID=1517589 RepID=UPI0013050D46|nr:phage/plasmid primase, P4 family [Nocardioides albidus]